MPDPMRKVWGILGWPLDVYDAEQADAFEPNDPKNPSWVDDVEDRAEQWAGEQQ